jgi:membrane peptidoglycan carboxypeptidase
VRGAPDPAFPPGSGGHRHSRGYSTGVGWWQPPARSAARPAAAGNPPGRVRRRAPGRAPADALTAPVGPALRGGLLAELDRGVPVRTAPNRRVPDRPGPDRTTPDRTTPGPTAPGPTAPDRTPPARIAAQRTPPQRDPAQRDPAQPPAPGRATPARPGQQPPERRGLRRLLPRLPRTRRGALQLATAALGAAALAPVVAFVLGYAFFAVPTPDDAVNNQVALIAYADGSQITRLVPEQGNRVVVPVEKVPPHVRRAVLAAEDRSFYSNPGFDLTGIVRAAWNQLRGGVGGGSTITQQYVKNTLVGDEATLWRKYREMVVAVKISQQRSKDEILGDYLNAIYFGRGAYGIQSAAHAYFGKPVSALTPAEGALLAGLIQSPSRWDPALNPEKAEQRWNFVLDGMVAQGWLPRAERDAAMFPPTIPRRPSTGGVPTDARGHIVTAVRTELEDLGITDQELSQAGLRITTTVDPARQQAAIDAAHAGLAGQPVNLRSAMVAVDPATGGILAYYGGDNGTGLDYARVRRLAGSTFKPFVVLAGLRESPPIGIGETFDGAARPGLRNAEGAECARCDLKQAMTVSNNVVFSDVARRVGPQKVADAARAAGITSPLDDPNEGIALGNKEVSTLELASAYATIAGGGVWHPPHLVSQVVTADGRVLYRARPDGEQRFPEQVARNVTEAMLGVADRDGLTLGRRPVAAKTGTVQSRFPGENNDAWMAGFTPQLAASVWMGTDRNSPIRTATGDPISGRTLPGEVWRGFMATALSGAPAESFVPFRPLGTPPTDAAPNAAPTPTAHPATPPPSAAPPESDPLPDGTEPLPDPADPAPDDESVRDPHGAHNSAHSAPDTREDDDAEAAPAEPPPSAASPAADPGDGDPPGGEARAPESQAPPAG